MNDFELIKKAKSGCNDSFDKLLKSRGEKLYRVAFYYVKDEHVALDIVSETTFKAYISIKKLKHIEYFDTWLVKILINEALTMIKKQKRIIHLADYKKDIEAEEVNPKIEEQSDLHTALDKLNLDDKEILVLKYFGDLTFSDIAKVMKKSESTVKTKHYRALDKLKNMLQGGSMK